jgi:hypothetical protein
MGRGVSIRGLVIGIIAFFIVLMVVVWVVAERANPKMIQPTETSRPMK